MYPSYVIVFFHIYRHAYEHRQKDLEREELV